MKNDDHVKTVLLRACEKALADILQASAEHPNTAEATVKVVHMSFRVGYKETTTEIVCAPVALL